MTKIASPFLKWLRVVGGSLLLAYMMFGAIPILIYYQARLSTSTGRIFYFDRHTAEGLLLVGAGLFMPTIARRLRIQAATTRGLGLLFILAGGLNIALSVVFGVASNVQVAVGAMLVAAGSYFAWSFDKERQIGEVTTRAAGIFFVVWGALYVGILIAIADWGRIEEFWYMPVMAVVLAGEGVLLGNLSRSAGKPSRRLVGMALPLLVGGAIYISVAFLGFVGSAFPSMLFSWPGLFWELVVAGMILSIASCLLPVLADRLGIDRASAMGVGFLLIVSGSRVIYVAGEVAIYIYPRLQTEFLLDGLFLVATAFVVPKCVALVRQGIAGIAPNFRWAEVLNLKRVGAGMMAIGMIWGVIAFNMDTTVEGYRGGRVHNIGMMDGRRNELTMAGLLVVVGTILFVAGYRRRRPVEAVIGTQPTESATQRPLAMYPAVRSLDADSYQLYLVKKYKVERNQVLEKFVIGERLFTTINEALAFAHDADVDSERKAHA